MNRVVIVAGLLVFLLLLYNMVEIFCGKRTMASVVRPITYKNNSKIPNIIFRTLNDMEVHKSMFDYCHQKWVEMNPDYSVIWFDNKQRDEFMKNNYNDRIVSAYNKIKPGAYKADIWRLCILYKYGGVYVDAYATPYIPISELLKTNNYPFISVLEYAGIHNGLLISEKEHPFLEQAIMDCVVNIENNYYGNSSLDITGPNCLGRSLNKVLNRPVDTKFNLGVNDDGDYSFYLYKFEWGPYQNIYDGDEKILSKYYSFLMYLHHKADKGAYHKMWKARDVYN